MTTNIGQKSTTHTPAHKRIGADRTGKEMAGKQGQATHLQWTPAPIFAYFLKCVEKNKWFLEKYGAAFFSIGLRVVELISRMVSQKRAAHVFSGIHGVTCDMSD